MASVYILQSPKLNKFYTGCCFDLVKRLKEHQDKIFQDAFTVAADDWSILLSIDNLTYRQARNIEAHIKRMKSRTYIENLMKYPEMLEKLKQRFQ